MNDVINPVKLKELEDKVDQFHHYMVCYKNADQNELKEQLDSLNRVILEEDQQLKQKLHYSKSEVAFRIGMAYEEVENIIRGRIYDGFCNADVRLCVTFRDESK